MKKIIIAVSAFLLLFSAGCGTGETPNGPGSTDPSENTGNGTSETAGIDSPAGAVAVFVEGVKARDEEAMRSALSEKTLNRFDKLAEESRKSFFEAVTGENLSEMSAIPELRNEKIDGNRATIEAKDAKSGGWKPVSFVRENGRWKIALFEDLAAEADQ